MGGRGRTSGEGKTIKLKTEQEMGREGKTSDTTSDKKHELTEEKNKSVCHEIRFCIIMVEEFFGLAT